MEIHLYLNILDGDNHWNFKARWTQVIVLGEEHNICSSFIDVEILNFCWFVDVNNVVTIKINEHEAKTFAYWIITNNLKVFLCTWD